MTSLTSTQATPAPALTPGQLKGVHHIALHVKEMEASRHFYGTVLGLHELTGDEVPSTLKKLVASGEVANFVLPDQTILDLFWKPKLQPPAENPEVEFTRAGHLAFDIAPHLFDHAIEVLHHHQVKIDHGPVSRPTGRGIYFYDPDGLLLEIRCDP
ncbi:MAG: VOC family protein [Elainellaceae cyanobacterium]